MFSVYNCQWILVVYTEHYFHLILGFNLSSQTLVFTSNWDSRKGYLKRLLNIDGLISTTMKSG